MITRACPIDAIHTKATAPPLVSGQLQGIHSDEESARTISNNFEFETRASSYKYHYCALLCSSIGI
jgi:hypothetical protein